MKRRNFLKTLSLFSFGFVANPLSNVNLFANKGGKNPLIEEPKEKDVSNVYFTSDISSEGVLKIYEYIKHKTQGKVAVKVHFGEEGNKYYVKPSLMKKLVTQIKGTFVETNVLYVGPRRYTNSHIELAKSHGFDYAPIDILDADGDIIYPYKGKHYNEIHIGKNIKNYQTILLLTHFKGHVGSGFGGAIKNVSMGLASVHGKMALHASDIPKTNNRKCIKCRNCISECPANAISISPLKIDKKKCIGCAKCIGICQDNAITIPWGSTENSVFMERLVEYAKGVADNNNLIYINFLIDITRQCDCMSNPGKPFVPNIGILASNDMVAVDNACHDLVDKAHSCNDTFLKENSVSGKHQIEYANKIGLGNKKYKLIDIDKLEKSKK